MFKIAYGAGHDLLEAGKNFEWHLNERVARYFAEAAAQYENVEIMRTDDPTGRTETRLAERCRKSNEWGADFGLSIHHNAGANGTSAGGLMAFAYRSAYEKTYAYRDAIYDACIAAGAIRGNRAEPKANAGFYVLRYTAMPTVLMEYGFMDSTIDRDIIDTEDYAKLVAYATMEGIAKVAGLEKKTDNGVPAPQPEQTAAEYTLEQFVREVQACIGARVDGIAGRETIGKTPTVSTSKNRTHDVVLPLQKRFAALGYTQVGRADGMTGPRFEAAVTEFQKDHHCWVDGEITAGNKTWRKLLGME